MSARGDIDRYRNGAILLENFEVLVQGGVTRRPGTRHVATVKYPTRLTLVKGFEPSTTDAYILEVGHMYIRFYKHGARLESPPGTPVEVATPYDEAYLRGLRTAQSNDVMLFVHPLYAPARLSRLSDTSWDFRLVPFYPPPTFEAGLTAAITLTLGATSGTGVSVTASAPLWLIADIDRVLSSGIGRGIIRTATSTTAATIDIIDAFTSTTLAPNTWKLERSPVAQIQPSKAGPIGSQVTVTLQVQQDAAAELVVGDLTTWTNLSGVAIATGTHTGGGNNADLQDSAANFLASGILATQIVLNETDGSTGVVASVLPNVLAIGDPGLINGAENDFDAGDVYSVLGTGGVAASGGTATLSGGTAGIGWITKELTTVAGTSYRVAFMVADNPLSAQVGTTGDASNLKAEASYPIGEQSFSFTATGTSSWLQFRNNQPHSSRVSNVSVKTFSVGGFRPTEVGSYVRTHQGLVRLTGYVNATQMTGEIVKELSNDDAAAAGAWSLEEPAWSAANGFPSAIVLYEGRLGFAGSARFPQTLWMSAIDDLFNFALGPNADDALELTLVDSGGNITLNLIRWLMPAENLLVGTTHGEYRLIGSGDDPLSPVTPPKNRIQSTFGSDTVQPLKVGAALLFAQRQGSKLREMAFDERTQTTFVARDITITSDHLLKDFRLLELAYQQEPHSVVWGVRNDGQLLGLTYDQSEQVVAWWRILTAGQIESVATIPHPTANAHQTWVAVARFGTTRCIEYLDHMAEMVLPEPVTMWNELTQASETITGWHGLTVDAARVFTGINTATLTGLAHLEGQTVAIVADGAVFPSQVVTGGQVVLSQAVHTAFVGLPYTPRGRTLPVEIPLRGTTQQGLRKRWAQIAARVQHTACLVLQGESLPFRQPHMPVSQGVAPFTGDRGPGLVLGWDRFGMVSFEVPDPLPCTIIGVYGTMDSEVRA